MGKSEKWNKEGKEKDVGLKRGSQVLLWLVREIKILSHTLSKREKEKERKREWVKIVKVRKFEEKKGVSYKEKSSLKPI